MISLILNCSEEKKKKKQTKPGQEAPFKKKKNPNNCTKAITFNYMFIFLENKDIVKMM